MEKKKNSKKKRIRINKKRFISVILTFVLIVFSVHLLINKIMPEKDLFEIKTKKGVRLVVESKKEDNKIIEFDFEDKKLSSIKIYQKFTDREEYKTVKHNFQIKLNEKIIKADDDRLSLEIERTDLGSDKGLTYKELYKKYVKTLKKSYKLVK